MARIRNFTPGPVEVSEEVLAAQYGSQGLHVGPEFAATYQRITRNLQQLTGTSGHVAVVPGCGTLANEMAFRALLSPGQTALILDAGYFSSVLRRSAEGCGARVIMLPVAAGKPADPADLARALSEHQVDLVCFTHVETSTGLLNPVAGLAAVARDAGVPVLVDSVSALGTCPVQMDDWGVTALTSASQKGLESVPGLGLVAMSEQAWETLSAKGGEEAGFTGLMRWKTQFETATDWHPSLTTMPVAVVNALDVALSRILTEGAGARYSRHQAARDFLCQAMQQAGLELQIEPGARAPGVTAVRTGGAFRSSDLVRALVRDHHIRIAGGFGPNSEEVFRVAHMGDNADVAALRPVVSAIESFLRDLR